MAEQPNKHSSSESKRQHRRIVEGVVVSDKRDKTIGVRIDSMVRHARYEKYIHRRTVVHAHDEGNVAHVGDAVEIMECRPISKQKSWRLLRVTKPGAAIVEGQEQS